MDTKKSSFGVFKIASAYIGTVVGAGFASGQEILQFFTAYGIVGILGVAISTLLFFFMGYSILMLSRSQNARSHVDIVCFTNGMVVGRFIDVVISTFLFGGFAAMIAGAGAIAKEQFAISPLWGMMIMAAASLLTVITGTKGVVSAISYVVPFLIFSVLFVAIFSLVCNPITTKDIQVASSLNGATFNWFMSAINYASYNIVIAIGVLTPIGAETEDKKRLLWGALLGAGGLGLGMLAIYFCLLTNVVNIQAMEIPMIEIAGRISVWFRIVFALVLFCEIYTTAVGNLYGFVQRLARFVSKPILALVITLLAFLVGLFGFSNMVRYLYPFIGYGGLLLLFGIIYTWLFKREALR